MNNNVELNISNILKDLGISPILTGYLYLKYAVQVTVQDESLIITKGVTTKLYPAVAEHFNSTTARVERAIRHAIERGWRRGNKATQNRLFGYTVEEDARYPTNGTFILTVADYLNMTQEEMHGD